jgi:heme exporter protein A
LGIEFCRIEKRYGALVALRRLSLSISPGEVVALFGANGSGKTTLLRLAAGLIRPTAGKIVFTTREGNPAGDVRSRIGFLAHSTFLYDDLTAEENLNFFAQLYGGRDTKARVPLALEQCGLAARAKSPVRTFSRGMRQRLALARALINQPSLLLLDEPTTGLDRLGLDWLVQVLADHRASGGTLLMSTHGQSPILQVATRAILLDRGVVVADSGPGGALGVVLEAAGVTHPPGAN